MNNIRTILADLPDTIGGYTVCTECDFFTIVLNQNLSYARNRETYLHELNHIMNGDFEKECSADLIEIFAHR